MLAHPVVTKPWHSRASTPSQTGDYELPRAGLAGLRSIMFEAVTTDPLFFQRLSSCSGVMSSGKSYGRLAVARGPSGTWHGSPKDSP